MKAVRALDMHGQRVIYTWLLERLLKLKSEGLLESHSSRPLPEKAERIPRDAGFERELSAWAKKQNIDLDEFMHDALKTIQG
ncbi:MAG: hypothetical protein C4542_04000 [Dehalococcoidia bacterium]|nr:MAG: hypothetical protein C4542_04000 [Dehalococcoidia bacterium]